MSLEVHRGRSAQRSIILHSLFSICLLSNPVIVIVEDLGTLEHLILYVQDVFL